MADYDARYGSKGAANTGVALGAVGTGLGLLNSGFFGGGWGRGFSGGHGGHEHGHRGGCDCDRRGPMVDRFELLESQKISGLESQNAFLRAELDTQRKFGIVETQIAHLQDAVCCLRGELKETNQRISQITATVIPSTVVWTPPAQVTTPEGGGNTLLQ